MTENKNMRIWQWAVLLLVLCNIGLIVTMWLKPQHMPNPPHGGGPKDFVIQQLKFTDDQVKKYNELIDAHQQAMQQLRQDGKGLREAMFANLRAGNGNNGVTDSLAQLIGNNQKQIELATYRHFAAVRALCTDDQKKEFDNIIGDVLKRMNGGPGGGRRPPPGDMQGPPPEREGGPPPEHDNGGPPPGDR